MRALFVLASLALSSTALAHTPVRQAGHAGVGLGAGLGVSGLSGKYFLADEHALQLVVGTWGLGRRQSHPFYGGGYSRNVSAGLDWLFELPVLFQDEEYDTVDIAWNVGLGGSAGVGELSWAGASGIVGLEILVRPIPVDLVLEYRPGLVLAEGYGLGIDFFGFSAHARIYVN